MPKNKKWIQTVSKDLKKGALHKQLNVPATKTIPKKTLQDVVKTEIGEKSHGITVTKLAKERSAFALNARRKKN